MGELLVSKRGLGYLIMYGSQVFNINLVITSVFILGIIAYLMYKLITIIENKYNKNNYSKKRFPEKSGWNYEQRTYTAEELESLYCN